MLVICTVHGQTRNSMFFVNIFIKIHTKYTILGPKLMFAECDKHYPIRSGQTTLAKAETPNLLRGLISGPVHYDRRGHRGALSSSVQVPKKIESELRCPLHRVEKGRAEKCEIMRALSVLRHSHAFNGCQLNDASKKL